MRRREIVARGTGDPRLTRYDAADWGGGPDAAQRWYDARVDWIRKHPDASAPEADFYPDVPFDPDSI